MTRDLWGDMVDRACKLLRAHEPPEGFFVAFSGGKDSIVMLDVVRRAGVKHDVHYNLTTNDPPELVHFIRDRYPDVEWIRPEKTMWRLIAVRGLPTRIGRYCCQELKELTGAGRIVVTGIRTAESNSRSKRREFERCTRTGGKWYLHPIKDWSDADVWTYIRSERLPYCCLYDEGFKRLGCVICPCNRKVAKSMERWPKIWAAGERAAKRYYDRKPRPVPFETFWGNWIRRDGPLMKPDVDESEMGTGLFT